MKGRHAERGSGMVEFAIVATALMLMLLGIVEFGRAMYTYHAVANAARIGSRWAMVRGAYSCSTATGRALSTCPADQTEIQAYVQSQVPLADASTLAVTAQWPGGNPGCTSTTQLKSPGCVVRVTVTDPFNFALPFISTATWNISSTSEMIISQ